MPNPPINNHLIGQGATAIYRAFSTYRSEFKDITRHATQRFKNHDWHGGRADAIRRLDINKEAADRIEFDIRRLLADQVQEKRVWAAIKSAYSGMLIQNDDWELAETFFNSILPHKRIAELYISTGFNKHGKTELYRDLLDHMTVCYIDRFNISPGQRGLVMIVFNLPRDDLVFNLIRDRFDTPKKTTRREIMAKYDLVYRHDRAGRLVDAQAFEHLKFNTSCFSPQLLAELKQDAGGTVRIENDYIILDHAYVERRVTPLDVFLNEADEPEAQKIVIEWGNAIKDLAASNIFPGDILLENFGVTRHGRVVFYDCDELCPLTSCRFRKLPPAYEDENEMASEPWFYVDENDVFPEEFQKFLRLPPLRNVFCEHHNDLCEVSFWQQAQQMIQAGELAHIYPYAHNCRLERK
jgi:isocitrate dehydrogenase kinase/phosphatase